MVFAGQGWAYLEIVEGAVSWDRVVGTDCGCLACSAGTRDRQLCLLHTVIIVVLQHACKELP